MFGPLDTKNPIGEVVDFKPPFPKKREVSMEPVDYLLQAFTPAELVIHIKPHLVHLFADRKVHLTLGYNND